MSATQQEAGKAGPQQSVSNNELPAAFWDALPDESHPDLQAINALKEESTPDDQAETLKVSPAPPQLRQISFHQVLWWL